MSGVGGELCMHSRRLKTQQYGQQRNNVSNEDPTKKERRSKMKTLEQLRAINFDKILNLPVKSPESYNIAQCWENGHQHPCPTGYCTACEKAGVNSSVSAPGFRLTNISHGAHSKDFLDALSEPVDTVGWHTEPVMFIYESPSLDYGLYDTVESHGYAKRPTKGWYWIHNGLKRAGYPDYFKGRAYGHFCLSAIITFKLENAYVTNLVKCGMANEEGQYRGLKAFRNECVQLCYDEVLSQEITTMNPRVIFCVGSGVESWVRYLTGPSYYIQQLPHPAGARRGFRDDHYRTLYFWLVAKSLFKQRVLDENELKDLAVLFARKFE